MISANCKKRDSARMKVRRYVMDLIYQAAGESVHLPSNKDLAAELGIACSTVQLELKLLLKEKFLMTRRGIGTFTIPQGSSLYQLPMIGILDGDGKIIYEPYFRFALKSHIGMALAKIPANIQEARLFFERENDIFEELRSIRCDALVCIEPTEKWQPLLMKFQRYRPVITIRSLLPGITGITLDHYRAGRFLGKALLAEGRKEVLFTQYPRYRETTLRGCRDVFAEAGIEIPDDHFFTGNFDGLEDLLKSGFRPQAAVPSLESFNHVTALLRKYGIDLYEECRLATFMFKPEKMSEPVMLFSFPFEKFGELAVEQVMKRMEDPALPPEHIVFDSDYQMNIV